MIMIILHVALTPEQLFTIYAFILLPAGLVYTLTIYAKIFCVSRESARIQSSTTFAVGNYGLSTIGNKGRAIERNFGLNAGNSHFFFS